MATSTPKKKAGFAPAGDALAKPAKKSTPAKSTTPAASTRPAAAKPGVRVSAKPATARSRAGDKTSGGKRTTTSSSLRATSDGAVARALMAFDDDDVLPSGGSGNGRGFGRCGGRMLSSRVERQLCDMLSREGVAHSHSPRHFEIKLEDDSMAAYAPMIVVRGRGREGKTIVIEALDQIEPSLLQKVRAFRKLYGLEFYVSFVGSEELLDEIPIDVYDESTVVQNVAALVSRLAD